MIASLEAGVVPWRQPGKARAAEMAKVRAIAQRGAEESALTEARAAQDRFWRALKRLELILGVDVDQTLDLRDYDCETLRERAE
jgi:hypothetical protein